MSEAFETARDFAAHELPVFPTHTVIDGRCTCGQDCASPGKHPRTPHGVKDATCDERWLLQWDERWPDSNWAYAAGQKSSVVDIDSKAGADPREVIEDYALSGPAVWTGEAMDGDLAGVRGAHVYRANGCRSGPTGAAGVEIRGAGYYVLLPGSRHVSGVTYQWANGARPWTERLEPVPETLVPRRQPKAHPGKSEREPWARVPHGARHNHLKEFAVALVRIGVTDERMILAHLWTQFREACEPEPEPQAGSLESLASWATGSDIAERERETGTAKGALTEASRILGMHPHDPLVHVWRADPHGETHMCARTNGGVQLRWEHQRDMVKPDTLIFPVLSADVPGPQKLPIPKPVAMRVFKLLASASETFEALDARDETREWLEGFHRVAVKFDDDLSDPDARWRAVRHLANYQPPPDDYGRRNERWTAPPLFRDSASGDLYIGRQDLADHLRKGRRVTVGWPALNARMREVGWATCELQAWEPGKNRSPGSYAKFRGYRWRG